MVSLAHSRIARFTTALGHACRLLEAFPGQTSRSKKGGKWGLVDVGQINVGQWRFVLWSIFQIDPVLRLRTKAPKNGCDHSHGCIEQAASLVVGLCSGSAGDWFTSLRCVGRVVRTTTTSIACGWVCFASQISRSVHLSTSECPHLPNH